MALASVWFRDDPVFRNAADNNPPLMKGTAGPSVRYLQQALIELGIPLPISTQKYGTPDGDYGTETKQAVELFQRRNGLAAESDGRVGRNTLALLDQKMVLSGKPRPILPPLGGGPAPLPTPVPAALEPLAAAAVAILREAAVQTVDFSYEYLWFGGSLLNQVARAIEQGRIKVAYDPKLEGWAEYIPFNDVEQKNQLNLSFNDPYQSAFHRSVVVHEAVHAYQDIQGYSRPKYSSEGMAYAVQAWYHMALVRHSGTPPELAWDPKVAAVFRAAVTEIEEARTAPLPLIVLHGVKISAALHQVPAYRRMDENIPYDGVA